jgi:hypothetical protein
MTDQPTLSKREAEWVLLHGATRAEARTLTARVDIDPKESQAVLTLIGYRSSQGAR